MDYNSGEYAVKSLKKYRVIDSEGLKIYKFPSFSAEIEDTIVYRDSELISKYDYYIDNQVSDWKYVYYDDKVGWVNGDESKLLFLDSINEDTFDETIFDRVLDIVDVNIPSIDRKKPIFKNMSLKSIIIFSFGGNMSIDNSFSNNCFN